MGRFEEIWRFETARCAVIFDAAPEHDLDLSWDDDGTVAEGLASGLYCAFVARVRVLIDGEEAGVDYLGQCIYESPSDFINASGYFRDMVREAVLQARLYASRPRIALRQIEGAAA
jgi:hypothetical protein